MVMSAILGLMKRIRAGAEPTDAKFRSSWTSGTSLMYLHPHHGRSYHKQCERDQYGVLSRFIARVRGFLLQHRDYLLNVVPTG